MLSIPIQGLSEDHFSKETEPNKPTQPRQSGSSTMEKNNFPSSQSSSMSKEVKHLIELKQQFSGAKAETIRTSGPVASQVPARFNSAIPYSEPNYTVNTKPLGVSSSGGLNSSGQNGSFQPNRIYSGNFSGEEQFSHSKPMSNFQQKSGPFISAYNPVAPKFSPYNLQPNSGMSGSQMGPSINPYGNPPKTIERFSNFQNPQERSSYPTPAPTQSRPGFSGGGPYQDRNFYGNSNDKSFHGVRVNQEQQSDELPKSAKEYVEKCLYVCNTEEETVKMQTYIIDKISNAKKAGTLHYLPWETYQVPNLSSTKSASNSGFSSFSSGPVGFPPGNSNFASSQRFTSKLSTPGVPQQGLIPGHSLQKGYSNLSNFQNNSDLNLIKRNWSDSSSAAYQFRNSIASGTSYNQDAAALKAQKEENLEDFSPQKGKKNKKKEETLNRMSLSSFGSQKEILERSNRFKSASEMKGNSSLSETKLRNKKSQKKVSMENSDAGGNKEESGLTFEEMAEKWKIIVEF